MTFPITKKSVSKFLFFAQPRYVQIKLSPDTGLKPVFCLRNFSAHFLRYQFQRRYCPNQPASHEVPSPGGLLHLGLSNKYTQNVQFVYGAYIRHHFPYLTVVFSQTNFPRQQLLEPIHQQIWYTHLAEQGVG